MPEITPAAHSWILAQNPLTEGIPRYADPTAMAAALCFDPLSGIQVRDLDLATRIGLLAAEKTPLQPTSVSVECGLVWQGMLQTNLDRRNPLQREARRAYWRTLTEAGRTPVGSTSLPTKGMAIHIAKGPTGTGKSVTADRFCGLYPQVIEHSECEAAGWKHFLQLVYLQVDMSADGSRGGFLTGILLQMDQILGTSYATTLRKQFRTVEQLTIATIARLVAHYTGILFIDEGQLRNLVKCGHAELIQLFLLQLMNSGIPIVFLGNERAFDWVEYSQDLSRLNLIRCARFSPPGSLIPGDPHSEATDHVRVLADVDWQTLVDGVMRFYLLQEPINDPDECAKLLCRCSGRIARLGLTLWTTAQSQALLAHGREHVVPTDILAAFESPDFDELRALAEGFSYRKPELLARYPDVASAFYQKIWGAPDDTGAPETNKPRDSDTQMSDASAQSRAVGKRSGRQQFDAEQKRKAKEDKKRASLGKELKPDDMRHDGVTQKMMEGLEGLRAAANAQQ